MQKYTPTINMHEVRELVFRRKDLVELCSSLPEDSSDRFAATELIQDIDAELEERLGSKSAVEQLLSRMQYAVRPSRTKRTRDNVQIAKGTGCLAIAGLVSLGTYLAASDGGTSVVLWGAMLFGAILIVRGLIGTLDR